MASRHFIADGQLSLLCYIAADNLVYAGSKLVAVISVENLNVNDNAVFAMRYTQGGITHFSCLLAKDCTEQSFLCGKLGFTLWSDFTYKDVSGTDFCADADNSALVKLAESVVAHVGNIAGDFFRSKLGVTGFKLIFFDMNGSKGVFFNKLFVDKNSILVVIAFPCHKADEHILAERNLSLAGGGTVADNLTLFNVLAFCNDRTLVYAGSLVGTEEFDNLVFVAFAVIVAFNDDSGGIDLCNRACVLRKDGYTGVNGGLVFHTGADEGSFGLEQRNRLLLHVRAHQSTVRVVVFKEGNHCGSDGNNHFRRNIHVVDPCGVNFDEFVFVSAGYLRYCKAIVLVKGGVCLSNDIIVLGICGHVLDFVKYNAGFFVNLAERRFDKAVFVYLCIGCKVGNKSDVGAFRGFDRTHTTIVAVMYVTNLEARTVTGKAAGTKRGQTALMSKLGKRVRLIHKLRKRRRAEEFFNGCNNRTDVYKSLRSDCFGILRLNGHTLADNSFNSGKTDTELVLKQLAHASDTAVAEVVDVVRTADTPVKVAHIVDRGENIVDDDVFRNEFVYVLFDKRNEEIFVIAGLFGNVGDNGKTYFFVDVELLEFFFGKVNIIFGIDHIVGNNLYYVTVHINLYFAHAFFIHKGGIRSGNGYAGVEQNFTGKRVCNRLCKGKTCYSSFKSKLFVVFIASYSGNFVSS